MAARPFFCYNHLMPRQKKNRGAALPTAFRENRRIIGVLVACVLLGSTMTYVLYNYTQNLLKARLQDRMLAIVMTAALQFDGDELLEFRSEADMGSDGYRRVVENLRSIRDTNENIKYAYIMRRTDDPSTLEFIADAMSLAPEDEMDEDGDGILSDEEIAPILGDTYPIDEYPVLRDEAFYHPSVDNELLPDQWGLMMASYAPIYDRNGNVAAVIGIDVVVDDFQRQTQATLLPFMLFIFALILLLTLLTLVIFRYQSERVEMMRELDRQKDELLSIVSHQLATPISAIKWYLEMLLDGDAGKLNKEQREELETMQRTSADLADLVSMILDVSRIQLGRMKVDRDKLDLKTFFEEITKGIEQAAKAKGVTFTVHMPATLPVAMLDRRLMRMTLENLLSNAVKYTPPKGKVHLDVQRKNGTLTYRVTDTGCGIPKKEQDQMFTKLFRASNVRDKIEGNGLGLYVAKGAVEAQDGTLTFESRSGGGATFTVTLPLRQTTESRKKDN